MSRPSVLLYDLEIARCIPSIKEDRKPAYEYCLGWDDHAGMGISVLVAYDFPTDSVHVYCEDNVWDFAALAQRRKHIVGFNSLAFDDRVVAAYGLTVKTTWDLRMELLKRVNGDTKRHAGRRLADWLQANNLPPKTESGARAPELWQDRQYGRVIDYCVQDVMLTKRLVERLPDLVDPLTGVTVHCVPPWLEPVTDDRQLDWIAGHAVTD